MKPKWYTMLPIHLHPEDNKIMKLEELRQNLEFSDDLFSMAIVNSCWSVIKAQEATLENLKKKLPNATDKELLKGVLFSRLEVKLKSPSPFDPPRKEILKQIERLSETIQNIDNFDELLTYIIEMEKDNLDDNDPLQKKIDSILFNNECL